MVLKRAGRAGPGGLGPPGDVLRSWIGQQVTSRKKGSLVFVPAVFLVCT